MKMKAASFSLLLIHLIIPLAANTITTPLSNEITVELLEQPTPPPRKYIPIVMWHGMGDTSNNVFSLGSFKKFLEQQLPSVYIKSIQIGKNPVEDFENSYFLNANQQIKLACNQIASDPQLKDGYNALGFSQGGLFIRAVAQRCPSPPMLNLISIGGPQQGVYGLPHCLYPSHEYCDYIRRVLNVGAYWSWMQNSLVQAEYWHDPLNEDAYRKGSVFLSDINNENQMNPSYRDNLTRLRKLVLIKFGNDSMVEPKDSEWFGFYAPGQAKTVLPLQKSKLYLEDRIGLKVLYESKRLDFLSSPGDHLRFTRQWFIDNIISKYLK